MAETPTYDDLMKQATAEGLEEAFDEHAKLAQAANADPAFAEALKAFNVPVAPAPAAAAAQGTPSKTAAAAPAPAAAPAEPAAEDIGKWVMSKLVG